MHSHKAQIFLRRITMKKSNSTKKAPSAFRKLGAVALITATLAMCFTACKQTGGGGGGKPKPTPTPAKYTVTLNQTANGNVTASPAIPTDKQVDKDTIITFTATANEGYKIGKWTVTGSVLEANTGADGSSTAKVKITADTTVSVSFESNSTPTPAKYTVTLNQTANGNVTASPAIPKDKQVDKDTIITFTATANAGYKIGKWTVTGSALEANTGADGSSTAKVKITADTTVSVSFESNSTPTPTKYTVTLNQTANGNVTASPEIPEDKKVAKDTVITFTATANSGYKIGKWTVTGSVLEAGTGADGSSTAKVKITADTTVSVSFEVTFVEGSASLILSPDNLTINVEAKTADGSAITVEGCKEATLKSGVETELHATGTTVILKGNITELDCSSNKLTELNVQGCVSLQELSCYENNLTTLNVQGLTSLQILDCSINKLTELNVQGFASLKELSCYENNLTTLNVQGLTSLQILDCSINKLTELNVQGLTSLKNLRYWGNKLNAQAMTKLLNALPDRELGDKAFAILYNEQSGKVEGNCKDFTQPEDLKKAFEGAKKRNWKLWKYNAGGKAEYM
ncbi:MAG: InlB B-repeat-containing protein [Treponema sp.]